MRIHSTSMWTQVTYNNEFQERFYRLRKILISLKSLELLPMLMALFGFPLRSFLCLPVAVMAQGIWIFKVIKMNGHMISLVWQRRIHSSFPSFWVCRFSLGEQWDTLELLWVWRISFVCTGILQRSIYQLPYVSFLFNAYNRTEIFYFACSFFVCYRKMHLIGSFCFSLWRGPCFSCSITFAMRFAASWAMKRCYHSLQWLGSWILVIRDWWAWLYAFFLAPCI